MSISKKTPETNDNDELVFASEESLEPEISPDMLPWKVMIVDDEKAIHGMTRRILSGVQFENRPLRFYSAYSGKDARKLIRSVPDTALILLDVVMETDQEGLDVVRFIREELGNHFVRIILRTGQPGQAPEREVITAYDINDYKLKSLLDDQGLYTAVISALRNYRDLRIIEKSREELRIAMEEAQVGHEAKYQFLANMSHEFRTPLNAILGFSDLLLDADDLHDTYKSYVKEIVEAGNGLLTVLTNVLDLTEMVEGRFVLKETPFDLNFMIQQVVNVASIQAQWKNVEVLLTIEPDVPEIIVGDEHRLQQVLTNLMANAIRHTQEGYVGLWVSLFPDDEENPQILFTVSDTGVGIPEDLQEKIFEPFVLAEDPMKKRFGGAGLGLAISKHIIEKMGGSVWVASSPNQGSTFNFTIRLNTSRT